MPQITDSESENFKKFLQILSPDPEKAGDAYLSLCKKLNRYFAIKGDALPEQASDLVIDRVTAKVGEEVVIENVIKYSLGIARLVALERFRQSQKEQIAWAGFSTQFLDGLDEAKEELYELMRVCLDELENSDRQVLFDYYRESGSEARTAWRMQMAENLQASLNKLRLRVHRLKSRLADCVKSKKERELTA